MRPLTLFMSVSAFALVLPAVVLAQRAPTSSDAPISPPASAMTSNPALTANIDGVNDAATKSNALKIGVMDIAIVMRGSVAETTVTTRFDNPSGRTLEGDYTLDMPAGSVVTGYALDVNGVMVDGVLVPPRQAQLAYVQRVTRRVDPGIAEVTRGSRFNTRVFPIFPGSGRTIRLKFVTPLDPVKGYQMPLVTPGSVGSFSLSIMSSGLEGAPSISLPRAISLVRAENGNQSFSAKDFATSGDIGIALSKQSSSIVLSEHRGEGRFFEISDSAPVTMKDAKGGGHIAIMWDRSRSRLDHKLAEEIALVERYLGQMNPRRIDLILFDSGAIEKVTLPNAAAVAAKLKAVRYGGATSFEKLGTLALDGADTCLLFSDGVSTLEKANAFKPACTLFAVASTREADRGFLESRTRRTGGEFFDLGQRSVDEILTRMTRSVPSVVDVVSESGDAVDYVLLDGGIAGWRVVGEAPNSGAIIVKIAGIGAGIVERRYAASPSAVNMFDGPGALWASSRISAASSDTDRKEILALARRYSVASPAASFIVLETPQDYAQAEIAPPMTYPKALRAQYDQMQAALEQGRATARSQRLTFVLGQWNGTRDWWTAKHVTAKRTVPETGNAADAAIDAAGRSSAGSPANASRPPRAERPRPPQSEMEPLPPPPPPPVMAPPPPPPPPPPLPAPPFPGENDVGDVVVTAQRRQENHQSTPVSVTSASGESLTRSSRRDRQAAASSAAEAGATVASSAQAKSSIDVQAWASDRPYIAAYDAKGADFASVFAAQEKKHGSLPAFYLDTAEWLANKGHTAEAARMAATALELPARNNTTLDIVAARLLRYGEVDRAIWLLEQLVALEPDRPQPRRSLALALSARAKMRTGAAARADLNRALTLLSEIIMTPWNADYQGAELVALFDANAIIPRLRALGETKFGLDSRLVGTLDTDIRIVVDWNTMATDMDLWVDEPNGERVIYSAQRSSSGGHLSDDMTAGYGPEQYFIRRAPQGRYTIRVNTFATDRLNPNGATNVTARLIRNYGRPDEREEMIDIEVLPGASGQRLVGRIDIKP